MEKNEYFSLKDLPLTLTVVEVGDVLRVGRNTAYELIRCGHIRSFKLNKQIRVSKEALIDFLSKANSDQCTDHE